VTTTVLHVSDLHFGNPAVPELIDAIEALIAERMEEMPSRDFSEMLRTVIREDEWLLYLHGAVLGFGAGLVHLAIFGV
jgi:hypothetical protein